MGRPDFFKNFNVSTKYKISDNQQLYFLTFAVVAWIDVFTRKEYKDIFIDSLRYCQEYKGLELYAFCLMPNHVHLIASVKKTANLSHVLRDLKKYSSYAITKAIKEHLQESRQDWMLWIFRKHGERNSNNTTYQFWQQDNHPIELKSNMFFRAKAGIYPPESGKGRNMFYSRRLYIQQRQLICRQGYHTSGYTY
nr:transposase [Pontibacter aydingkolensis]